MEEDRYIRLPRTMIPEQQVSALLAKLQAPTPNEIADMPTLIQVVQRASLTVPTRVQPNHCPSKNTGGAHAFRVSPVPTTPDALNGVKPLEADNSQVSSHGYDTTSVAFLQRIWYYI
jgi:hypothetical protein